MTTPKKDEKTELLERMWIAQAKALVAILENTPAQDVPAAVLNVARQFLTDQNLNVESFGRKEAMAGEIKARLDALPDEPDPQEFNSIEDVLAAPQEKPQEDYSDD